MKKLLIIFIFIPVLLTACSSLPKSGMSIKPSEFSKETKKVLEVFDDEVRFFNLSLDETAKSQTISVWVFRDGKWNEDGLTTGKIEALHSQIAIRLTNHSYDLYVLDKSGHVKYSYPALETDFENSMGIGGTIIDRTTTIELNKEIPIWVKVGTDQNSMRVTDITEDFRNSDCTAGIAITLTISDTMVE